MESLQVLMIEDNLSDALLVREALADFPSLRFDLAHAERLGDGLKLLAQRRFDVVMLDLSLPDAHGLETVRRVHGAEPALPIVVLTGQRDEALGLETLRLGAQDYLNKGEISGGLLGRSLRFAIERKRAEEAVVERERSQRVMDEMRREEQALRQSEAYFRMMAEALPQLVWTARPDGTIEYVNARLTEYSGQTAADVLTNDRWIEVVHPEDRPQTLEMWADAVRTGRLYQIEFRLRRADGVYHWFINRALPMHDASGTIVRWFGTSTDIDAQKAAEARLIEADRLKDEFLAMLAHELRNPLAPVRNAAQILRVIGSKDPVVQRQHDTIERQVTHMARLLDDLLDVSRVTQGKIELRRRLLPLADVLHQAVETVAPLIQKRGQILHFNAMLDGLLVEGDQDRLVQVVGNLLNNAAKYTGEGGEIWLEAGREADGVVVRVRDTGIGIAPEMLAHIFDMFAQADQSLARSQGGLGIGLTMAQRLVQMHGGSIQACSAGPGAGSEFTVRLPVPTEVRHPVNGQNPSRRTGSTATARRVLVVDDVPDSAATLSELLALWGYQVQAAHRGTEALEMARTYRPEVVLLDLGMPGMDGCEVARHLRDEYGDELTLIALTGYGQPQDRQKTREAGFDHHMVKPVELERLRELLGRTPGAV